MWEMEKESQSAEEPIMSDPAVSAFLTQLLCAHGGRLLVSEIPQHLNLPPAHIASILLEESSRFLLLEQCGVVLALSAVRLCNNYLREQCQGLDCERLHLCRFFVLGKCFHRGKGNTCTFSHDIDSEVNKAVLKANKISNLTMKELQVLLCQNDPSCLPEVCTDFNKKDGSCTKGVTCSRLHICRYFLKGRCWYPRCNKSHYLQDPNATQVLQAQGLNNELIESIQLMYNHLCNEAQKESRKNYIKVKSHSTTDISQSRKVISAQAQQACIPDARELVRPLCPPTSTCTVVRPSMGPTPQPTTSTYRAYPGTTPHTGKPNTQAPTSTLKAPALAAPHRSSSSLSLPGSVRPTTAAIDSRKEVSSMAPAPKDCGDPNEICLYHIWKFCKNQNKCSQVHYYLPYRWQILVETGEWKDLPLMEDIEKAYCDPNNTRSKNDNIDFEKMTSSSNQVRRLSTASSVTKSPEYILTTEWVWYWKNEHDQWIEYGKHGGKETAACTSMTLESAYLADKKAVVPFVAGGQKYEMHFQDMIQRNLVFRTEKKVLRRPRFLSQEDVMKLKRSGKATPVTSAVQAIPAYWDRTALPNMGYQLVKVHRGSSEFNEIQRKFEKTMSGHSIQKINRIQNPSLWQVYQMQMKRMKTLNKEKDVLDLKLFHSTNTLHVETICHDNFDWRNYGVSATFYGKGSYFSRDASYSHQYCQSSSNSKTMFLARVLVGDYVKGNPSYTRPPPKPSNVSNLYDSCVDDEYNPSIFVIFEKHQIYPEYVLNYTENKKQDSAADMPWANVPNKVQDKVQEKPQDKPKDQSICCIS